MAETRGVQRGWWAGFPAPLRIVAEAIAACIVVTTLSGYLGPLFAGLEVVLLALVVAGIAHSLGKLPSIDEYPALRAFFDWYAPSSRRPPVEPIKPAVGPIGPEPSKEKPPDTTNFKGVESVKKRLEELSRSPFTTGKVPPPGVIIALVGPKGTGKSKIAHEWAAGLSKAGRRKSKDLYVVSKAAISGLPAVSHGTLALVRATAEASLDGVLLIDDLDCLIPPSDAQIGLVGEVLADVAERNPQRLLIVASGSKEAFARLDPSRSWMIQFLDGVVEVPGLDEDALFAIFSELIAEEGKRLEDGIDTTFKLKLREIEDAKFANALTIRQLAARLLTQAGTPSRQTITKAELRAATLT